ncbi:hypothetical protein CY652_19090 [Burkholderia sp. WAC0059]|uniref:hypothetical protein n=1 Tax=Burkholderia sp. WAC0059 TaxID=2066022 RepID=UPI000C7EBDD2|nr:hypothetical protein [Burkholderia sp. WAC0059]PLZ00771.1 hypothetical protein CY652_19090 [Burkholderia sp. WAC0059]
MKWNFIPDSPPNLKALIYQGFFFSRLAKRLQNSTSQVIRHHADSASGLPAASQPLSDQPLTETADRFDALRHFSKTRAGRGVRVAPKLSRNDVDAIRRWVCEG